MGLRMEEGRVTIELKTSKKQLVQVPWEDILLQVEAAKRASLER